MNFDYSLDPINGTAKNVISQKGCTNDVLLKDKSSYVKILEKLKERQKVLRGMLGIKTKSQLKNMKYYRKKKSYNINRKLFQELLENGQRIQDITDELAKIKQKRKTDNNRLEQMNGSS